MGAAEALHAGPPAFRSPLGAQQLHIRDLSRVKKISREAVHPVYGQVERTILALYGIIRNKSAGIRRSPTRPLLRGGRPSYVRAALGPRQNTEEEDAPLDVTLWEGRLAELAATVKDEPSTFGGTALEFAADFENVGDADKDWHPETNEQVLDLVHPSLYCLEDGKSKALRAETIQSFADSLRFINTGDVLPVKLSTIEAYDFQWLPTDVNITYNADAAGNRVQCKFQSYINNIHPARTAAYDAPHVIYLGTKWQVIVKMANIELTPEKPGYPGGSLHLEGTAREDIVATGIYYYSIDNITTSRLSFQSAFDSEEGVNWDYEQDDHVEINEILGVLNH
ncbi:uncharacterized protein EV422DRAFT_505975 [Fimicolochytrium jonesii]|uniref:uncharacterized protein n=1 Tax=Fimicolochytrium jonesii TaxID=1396493 RepID=UPI0022FE7E8E|nr:uncharacterized protein EV422DRAFT_505975 [Fimicolochytrium jonesii]KAI8821261.1 hypothetical protein EV422DRAFT_505975 [Fimicolochytrium jonesii]